VTKLRLIPDLPTEIQEGAAALQDLACRFAPEQGADSRQARLAELTRIEEGLASAIQVQANGPYLVTNAARMTNWLGESLEVLPQMALCRCGQSAMKPLCDGTHARVGFTDEKDPKRVSDRDAYVGQQVTILDNRGTCQHSGYCTDRLASVFHLDEEPFVTPSGGRIDEILRAVRDCPSGALSLALDGREAREQVDYNGQREPAIEISKDGPYRITGGIALIDADGDPEPRNEAAPCEHYALCRCGHSQNKPFCSGMHWNVDFEDPVVDPDHDQTVFEWCGGLPALTRMTRLFYEKYVPEDPLLAPLFANMSPDHPQRVAKWLGEVFGGPENYSAEYGGYPRMVSQHMGKGLTEEQRARWVSLLLRSSHEVARRSRVGAAFRSYIEWGSRLAVENSQPGAKPPERMPMPHWDWNTAAGPPGSRISAVAAPAEEEAPSIVLPGLDETVSFDEHIKPMFRRRDRQSMKFAFDLGDHADVARHADAILDRLRAGTMPCDGAWPKERIDVFERWVRSGTAA
jgi:CDGSH-type Zn-finger protein/truncated hemoglobin YjbI